MKLSRFQSVCQILVLGFLAMRISAAELPREELKGLASDQFTERQMAFANLQSWSLKNKEAAPELLHQVWAESQDAEVKSRCYSLMKEALLLRKFGRGRGFVGILMNSIDVKKELKQEAQHMAVQITEVVANTPAEKAQLRPGDMILKVDHLDFGNLSKKQKVGLPLMQGGMDVRPLFQEYVKSKQPDDVITLHLLREGKKLQVKVTLMKRPASADRVPYFGQELQEADKKRLFFDKWLEQQKKN